MNTKEIVRKIVKEIFNEKLKPNDKLPSEIQMTIKYNVSRIVVTNAYKTLQTIGAIYSKPKKGFFISENFSGITRSLSNQYKATLIKKSLTSLDLPTYNKNSKVKGKYLTYKADHYLNNKIIIKSHNWLNDKIIDFNSTEDLIFKMIWSNQIVNSDIFIEYESFSAFNKKMNYVITSIYYTKSEIAFIQKAVVLPEIFLFSKKEWSI